MKIKIVTTEVVRGSQYKGTIDFGGRTFAFTITFTISIDKMDEAVETGDIKTGDLPKLFPITLSDPQGKVMELSDLEYATLFGLLGEPCIDLHANQQAKASTDPRGYLASKLIQISPDFTVTASLTKVFEVLDDPLPPRFKAAA